MIVTFPKKTGLLRGNVVKLDKHPLHSHFSAVEATSKDKGAVASRTKLILHVDLDVSKLEYRTGNGLHIGRDGDHVRFQGRVVAEFLSLLNSVFHRGGALLVITRGRRVNFLGTVLPMLDAATPATVGFTFLLLGGRCRGILGIRLGRRRLSGRISRAGWLGGRLGRVLGLCSIDLGRLALNGAAILGLIRCGGLWLILLGGSGGLNRLLLLLLLPFLLLFLVLRLLLFGIIFRDGLGLRWQHRYTTSIGGRFGSDRVASLGRLLPLKKELL